MTQCQRCGKHNVDIHTCTPPRAIEVGRIITALTDYRSNNNELRFGQLLFNIGYLEFPEGKEGQGVVKDPYNTSDSVLLEKLINKNHL